MKGPATVFAALTLVVLSFSSCGETDKHGPGTSPGDESGGAAGQTSEMTEAGGAGGATGISVPDPVACGRVTCKAIVLGGTAIAPCCADPLKGACGADVPPLGCQPLTQPGTLSLSCPASPTNNVGGLPIPPAPGCCREDGLCGFFISDLGGLLPFAPGCVDPTPFLNGQKPVRCDGKSPGAGGGTSEETGGAPSVEPGQGGSPGTAGSAESGGAESGGAESGGAAPT